MTTRTTSIAAKLAVLAFGVMASTFANAALQEVTVLLPGSPMFTSFAPWMVAQQKGYYAQEGLKLNFIAAKGGVDVAKQVGAGNAMIGSAIGDTPIIVRGNGVPVKAVAVLGSGSLASVLIKKDGPVKTAADLKGRTINVVSYSDTTYYALLGTLKMNRMTKDDVSIQSAGPSGVWQLFASGKADAMASTPDWLVEVQEATNGNVQMLHADSFHGMAQAILASDEAIEKNPDIVAKIVRGTLHGMQDIIKDPKASAAVYTEAVPVFKGKEDHIERIMKAYTQYVYGDADAAGRIDAKRLADVQNFYVSEGIVTKSLPLTDLYTNQFTGGDK